MIANSRTIAVGVALGAALALHPDIALLGADGSVLRLRAIPVGAGANEAPLTIDLSRWSTEAERSPLLAALSPPPAPPAAPAADATGRGGRAGRGGRGGRGAAPPPSPLARLSAAVKAAPTVGFVWGEGVTGYSIKYAWRAPSGDGGAARIVLVTDRRLGAHAQGWAPASASASDAEFTVIEMRLDAKDAGEAKTSLTAGVVVDPAAQTLALDGYPAAPVQLKVTR